MAEAHARPSRQDSVALLLVVLVMPSGVVISIVNVTSVPAGTSPNTVGHAIFMRSSLTNVGRMVSSCADSPS